MKNFIVLLIILFSAFCCGCNIYKSLNPNDYKKDLYNGSSLNIDQYDNYNDKGSYWLPQQKLGKEYWVVVNANSNLNSYDDNSLRNHILAESIIGLTSLAVNEGRGETMVWTEMQNPDYNAVRDNLGLINKGTQTTWELLELYPEIRKQIDGYILCNVRKQESLSVAAVASHVFRAIIVDAAYEAKVKALGYELKYDASNKTLADGWAEFKDKCKNNSLVMMPTLTGNNKSYAIANRLMVVNYNKTAESASAGNNRSLITVILNWLQPLSPVVGWEQNVDERSFVNLVSKSGNLMVPCDWISNLSFMSANYSEKVVGIAKATVTNPQFIKFDDKSKYAAFFLSDGDNVQWMMNAFRNDTYYFNIDNQKTKMAYGLPIANLSMIAPFQLNKIISEQIPGNSLIEFGGGGYTYVDNFADTKNRSEILNNLTIQVGNHMRQHQVNVLGLFSDNVVSEKSKEAYQAYIQNNDELIGIIAIQYDPYAGGDGQIMWFKNSKGYDIPVVTTRYSIWNFGNKNTRNQGTPSFVASKINSAPIESSPFSLVAVHAWSRFADIGESNDLLAENTNGTKSGATPVSWCQRRLNADVKVVNVEELIWQLRMRERTEQTKQFLAEYYK
jgi:hypothetical protein